MHEITIIKKNHILEFIDVCHVTKLDLIVILERF